MKQPLSTLQDWHLLSFSNFISQGHSRGTPCRHAPKPVCMKEGGHCEEAQGDTLVNINIREGRLEIMTPITVLGIFQPPRNSGKPLADSHFSKRHYRKALLSLAQAVLLVRRMALVDHDYAGQTQRKFSDGSVERAIWGVRLAVDWLCPKCSARLGSTELNMRTTPAPLSARQASMQSCPPPPATTTAIREEGRAKVFLFISSNTR
ncbi:hypothetical protein EYF80_037318 [Liparis tanakae]|uniref:Uncharacterized protein n=1 Tax=Liparis tanakae TaxID=230148 RepID=A0A4Z2GGY2_9TELE|nr:hypothetical protein EYF80_037318 [Liparis tanakae]